ncbi:MAG: hypothetical protein ACUZ8E_17620 [Candidatus Anammoxibacter sp.]
MNSGKQESVGDVEYSVRVDGHEITRVILSKEEWRLQTGRDKVRSRMALAYEIPRHYIQLKQARLLKYKWNEETQKNEPITDWD